MCRGNTILVEDLPMGMQGTKSPKRKENAQNWILADWIERELENCQKLNIKGSYYSHIISQVEQELIKQVLILTSGKRIETAETLGITRNTLRTKMNNYGLD